MVHSTAMGICDGDTGNYRLYSTVTGICDGDTDNTYYRLSCCYVNVQLKAQNCVCNSLAKASTHYSSR